MPVARLWIAISLTLLICSAAKCNAAELSLQDAIKLPDQLIAPAASVDLSLPALPAKAGKVVVLKLKIVCEYPAPAGGNYNAAVLLNGTGMRNFTSGGDERLIGRDKSLEFTSDYTGLYSVMSGQALLVLFAPDIKTGDAMSKDGLGATFTLNISDMVRGVDGNTLTIANKLKTAPESGNGNLIVQGIEVGWLDKNLIPKPVSIVPERGRIKDSVKSNGMVLSCGKGGGFALTDGKRELLIETALGMQSTAESVLIADDAPPSSTVNIKYAKHGTSGFQASFVLPGLRMTRTLELKKGLLVWKERWTNTGDKTIGVPFRHRLFMRGKPAEIFLGGSSESNGMIGCSSNPTVFLGSAGNGFGVSAESDWLRLLMSLRSRGGVAEIHSDTLALAPNKSIDFELNISPVRDGGGYWTFINNLRERWKVNGITAKRPVFWGGYNLTADGASLEEKLKKSLGNLGPIYLALGPWIDTLPDIRTVTSGNYPKLASGAPDISEFLTYKHREPFWQDFSKEVENIHKACPNVKVIQLIHPAMRVAYMPEKDKWPIAKDAILQLDGTPFNDAGYNRAWLGDYVDKGWAIIYYLPLPGSKHLSNMLAGMKRSMTDSKTDGIYSDEFSWAFGNRNYSRYDYSGWDGYSADLDSNGAVIHLKSDNAYTTESCQMQMYQECAKQGKFFLTNGGRSLNSITKLPFQTFVEGGNGTGFMVSGHLNPTPLVLGNMGDTTTLSGVFESVKECLLNGSIYSPIDINLLLNGPDNFVCKLYPITVKKILPGTVIGKERLITMLSGEYKWLPNGTTVRSYKYDSTGKLQSPPTAAKIGSNGKLRLVVPKGGLVIVERVGGL